MPYEFIYETRINCSSEVAAVMIPLPAHDLSRFEESEEWKAVVKLLLEIQTEEWRESHLSQESVAEMVGYIRRSDIFAYYSQFRDAQSPQIVLWCRKLFSWVKSKLRRSPQSKDENS